MDLIIKINCDGADLTDVLEYNPPDETGPAPVLRAVTFSHAGTVRDVNGNSVGTWTFAPAEKTNPPS